MSFGQLVIGPPGAGKTTYCTAMHQFLQAQKRPVAVVNLDPANYSLPYPAAMDIKDLISMEDVMETFQLGPNGGLVYCIEYLEKNLAWLKQGIKQQQKINPNTYFLFDLPGQVELYTHHQSLKAIVDKMTESWGMRLTCVHLIDSHHCSDPAKYLSVLLLSLSSMTQLSLPHVNVLSKMDLIESMGALEFGLEFYTDVLDLSYLLPRIKQTSTKSHPLSRKFARLHAALADLIESYNLVSFVPLDVQNAELLAQVARVVDKANGYMYVAEQSADTGRGAAGATTQGQQQQQQAAQPRSLLSMVDKSHMQEVNLPDIQERYVKSAQYDPPASQRATSKAAEPAHAPAAAGSVVERSGMS